MKLNYITTFLFFLIILNSFGEDINLNQTSSNQPIDKRFTAASNITINDQLDYKLDSNNNLIDSLHFTEAYLNLLKDLQIQDYRFPGGTLGNYYHFNDNGNGIDTNDMVCKPKRGYVFDQLRFDQFFTKNTMHYFVEFMHNMSNQSNESKGIYYHLNIHKHIYHKQLMAANPYINATLNALFDSATINQSVNNFSPSDLDYYVNKLSTIKRNNFTNSIKNYLANDSAFRYYFLENIASINFLLANNIKVKGIELGNETQAEYLLYDDDLSLLGYDCYNVPDTIEVNGFDNLRMRDYLEGIYKFWVITSIYADFIKANYHIPTGVPASLHFAYLFADNDNTYQIRDDYGLAERQAHLWNRFLANDSTYDAMIPHYYTARYIPCEIYDSVLTIVSMEQLYNYSLDFLKKSAEDLFNYQMTQLLDDIGNKRIWVTEWNLNGNTYMNNTFMHSYFIQQMFLNAIKIHEQNLFNIDTWIIHNMASSSYVFALVQSASRGNGHIYKKFLGPEIFQMWNTTLNHKVKRLNYDWNTLINNSNHFVTVDGFINEQKDTLYIHFANPTSDTFLLDFNNITFTNDTTDLIGAVVKEHILNANSWQSNNTACYVLALDTLDKSYIIKNQPIDFGKSYTIPSFSIGKIAVALYKDIPSKINNNLKSFKFKIYPNITKHTITVEINNKNALNNTYQIITQEGKIITQFYNNQSVFILDVQQYNNGMYYLKAINSKQDYAIQKFIIQH